MKTGLRTTKPRLNCSLRGLHYPRHLKNNAEFAKIKRSPVKFNFQEHPEVVVNALAGQHFKLAYEFRDQHFSSYFEVPVIHIIPCIF